MSDHSDRIIRIKTVLAMTGMSRSTLYRKVEAGTFPHQINIAVRCVGWHQSAVSDWIRDPKGYRVA